ncbi:hypothetical protein [Nonomuraea turcica]|uniref:hypothetical protein n=1 Tax=Nonomuraea sp. G32 TaxID=3067274 RepID=UPI00273B97A7|nr:hypothetical protein [Nonomuraea sp. G32]MDP4511270.1 hypothetical protein [Nonomuraea sp. G32]
MRTFIGVSCLRAGRRPHLLIDISWILLADQASRHTVDPPQADSLQYIEISEISEDSQRFAILLHGGGG